MTYCVGILCDDGFVCAADSRTNAGVDHISTYRKLFVFSNPGERVMVLMTAGNLATSQSVISMVSERLEEGTEETSLLKASSMFGAARIVGEALRETLEHDGDHVRAEKADPTASFILCGQIKDRPVRMFQIYSAGNFVEASSDSPFFQIGETKYGKPILDRIVDHRMPLDRAAKAALVSFDSTMRSNVSVGPPIDVIAYHRDRLTISDKTSLDESNAYFSYIRKQYGEGLLAVFDGLPEPDFDGLV